jgi:uncharacterized protein (DUF2141 family)
MKRLLICTLLAALPAAAQETPPEILGPQPEACAEGAAGPAVLVHVHGFKDLSGNLRVELYPAVEGDFLAPAVKLRSEGKVFQRIDVPTPQTGEVDVCVALPTPGPYAMAVLHDRNASGKLDVFSDGFGFPNNPRLGYGKPDVTEATIVVADEVMRIDVVLNYWNGFAARPLRNAR